MGNVINGLLGINLASLIRGFRLGQMEFRIKSCDATLAVNPFESTSLANIPVVELDELWGEGKATIALDIQPYEDGTLTWKEAITLLSLVVLANPSAILEIGTFMGSTTWAVARNLPNAVIHTLDLPPDFLPEIDPATQLLKDDFHLIVKRQPGRDFIGTPEAARIRQHFGDSATWDFTAATGATCFFIDGSHTYEYCKIDSEKCYELSGGKGIFFWHDCDDIHPGVVRLVTEWRQLGRRIFRVKDTRICCWDCR